MANEVVAMLGTVEFSVPDGTIQRLRRSTSWGLDRSSPIDGLGHIQHRGLKADRITLSGVVFPGVTGNLQSVQRLRDLGDTGEAQTLVDGEGSVYGKWFLSSVEEEATHHTGQGKPRRQTFVVVLEREPEVAA